MREGKSTHRVVGSTRGGRSGEQLEVGDALGSVTDLGEGGGQRRLLRTRTRRLTEVPMQSFPVSPPPMTMTLRPLAERYLSSSRLELRRDAVFNERNSMAKLRDAVSHGTRARNERRRTGYRPSCGWGG